MERGRLHALLGNDVQAEEDLEMAVALFEAVLFKTDDIREGTAQARGLLEESK